MSTILEKLNILEHKVESAVSLLKTEKEKVMKLEEENKALKEQVSDEISKYTKLNEEYTEFKVSQQELQNEIETLKQKVESMLKDLDEIPGIASEPQGISQKEFDEAYNEGLKQIEQNNNSSPEQALPEQPLPVQASHDQVAPEQQGADKTESEIPSDTENKHIESVSSNEPDSESIAQDEDFDDEEEDDDEIDDEIDDIDFNELPETDVESEKLNDNTLFDEEEPSLLPKDDLI